MRVHEVAVLVHRADAVGVAVVDEAGVKAQLGNLRDAAVDPGRNGLGVQTVERRVLGVVDLAYFHAQVAQQLRQIDAAGAVQRVHHHAQVGVADGLDVHALLQGGEVRGHEVDRFERTARVGGRVGERGLHAIGELLARRAAVAHAQLHAQVLSRVVAAGQHDAAHRVGVLRHRPAQRGRGAVVLRQQHAEPLRCGNLGRQLCVSVRILSAIVTDDEGAGRVGRTAGCNRVLLEHARSRVDDAHEVVVGEVLADEGSPSIGSEMNFCHGASFLKACCSPV